jgi:hypothetical protein
MNDHQQIVFFAYQSLLYSIGVLVLAYMCVSPLSHIVLVWRAIFFSYDTINILVYACITFIYSKEIMLLNDVGLPVYAARNTLIHSLTHWGYYEQVSACNVSACGSLLVLVTYGNYVQGSACNMYSDVHVPL